MKLDADTLRAEAEAHRARMQSPLWADDGDKRDDSWTAKLGQEARPSPRSPVEEATRERTTQPRPIERESLLAETEETTRSPSRTRAKAPEHTMQEILPRLDALDHAVEKLTAALSRRPLGGGDAPGWLATAAGDPHTYDAPDADRRGVCVRVLPATYAQLQQLQRKLGLRTTAGAWEFLLRLGFAAADRLPA